MADTKITALAAIGANPIIPSTFPIPMVDLTDTSMAASGTTKKVTVNQILQAGGTATLASATISGDLTVDTNTLKVDSVNNRVGVLTASPVNTLHVNGEVTLPINNLQYWNAYYSSGFKSVAAGYAGYTAFATNGDFVVANTDTSAAGAASALTFYNRYRISNAGIHTWEYVGGVAGTAMTLNSTGLGVGVTPTAGRGAVQLSAGVGFPATQVASTDPNTLDDYEEGTWTGTLTGGTTNPTTPVTATGQYTKIGRQVSIQIQFTNVDTTGASGQIKVTGAPFANNSSVSSTGAVLLSSIGTFTGSPTAFIGVSTTEIELYSSSSGGAAGLVTHNAGASRSLYINLTYTV